MAAKKRAAKAAIKYGKRFVKRAAKVIEGKMTWEEALNPPPPNQMAEARKRVAAAMKKKKVADKARVVVEKVLKEKRRVQAPKPAKVYDNPNIMYPYWPRTRESLEFEAIFTPELSKKARNQAKKAVAKAKEQARKVNPAAKVKKRYVPAKKKG